jgi:predicted AAA+ superfamily ATPase
MIATQGYLDETRRVDLGRLEGAKRDPENLARVIRSLARNTATEASARTIAADVAGAEGGIDYHTVIDYTNALTRVFVVEDLPAWSPALRSSGPLRSSVTRHFADPSLAAAALGAGVERLLGDPETLGLLFESLVVRDLRVYGQAIGASVWHYRDAQGVEADAILEMRDGRWAALEVKLGQAKIDEGAKSLLRVVEHVDTDRHGRPAFLAVVTGWGYAYRRPDGVFVIPMGALVA